MSIFIGPTGWFLADCGLGVHAWLVYFQHNHIWFLFFTSESRVQSCLPQFESPLWTCHDFISWFPDYPPCHFDFLLTGSHFFHLFFLICPFLHTSVHSFWAERIRYIPVPTNWLVLLWMGTSLLSFFLWNKLFFFGSTPSFLSQKTCLQSSLLMRSLEMVALKKVLKRQLQALSIQ